MRLFVGLDLPWEARERLAGLSGSGIPGARWVPIENYHLTLRFIGEVPPYRAEELDEALAALRGKRFALELNGVGTFLGSGGCIVMDDSGCIVRASWRLAQFYRHESCGKCTPCREGTGWLANILGRMVHGEGRGEEDIRLLESLFGRIEGRTLCPLADGAVMPIQSALDLFRDEFIRVAHEGSPRPVPMTEAPVG